jgi:hypothetical protein
MLAKFVHPFDISKFKLKYCIQVYIVYCLVYESPARDNYTLKKGHSMTQNYP